LPIAARQGGSVPAANQSVPSRSLSNANLHEEAHLKVLRLLQSNPRMNQRDLADALGVSLGKANYCLKALLDKGLIKMQNFRNNNHKRAYAYLLTPSGVAAKAEMTVQFLRYKIDEYERLKGEIESLRREIP